ncbi:MULTISPECIES: hypothetical protein [unclassified Aeromicrobium]|uniref:hypothetical protein n=1 Tax=unclassified Aeromicrobium TaxID=2633570 RepID=UPI00396B1D9F
MSTTTTPTSPTALARVRAIAGSEFRLIARSKAVLFSATALPLMFAAFLFVQRETAVEASDDTTASVGMVSMVVMFFVMFTVYITATTTLVTRRQDLFLKRLRSGESSDLVILTGLLVPPVLLCLGQTLLVLVAMVALGNGMPGAWWWLLVALVGLLASSVTAATATAALTPNASAAQISSMPYVALALGTLIASPMTENRWLDLTPGGALVTLVRAAYEMDVYGNVGVAVAGLALWTYFGYDLSKRLFRWEPRH